MVFEPLIFQVRVLLLDSLQQLGQLAAAWTACSSLDSLQQLGQLASARSDSLKNRPFLLQLCLLFISIFSHLVITLFFFILQTIQHHIIIYFVY
jgi:hypothetical protein